MAYKGYKELAALLLANRAEVDARDNDGATPLHRAADQGRTEILQVLLANKADANARDNQGYTTLHHAANIGVATWLRQNASVNATFTPPSGNPKAERRKRRLDFSSVCRVRPGKLGNKAETDPVSDANVRRSCEAPQ